LFFPFRPAWRARSTCWWARWNWCWRLIGGASPCFSLGCSWIAEWASGFAGDWP
jgi:hypothetical protein